MIDRLFLEHPRCVNESYGEHLSAAFGVGGRLLVASLKCFVHGLVPGLYKTAGSDAIVALHREIAPRKYDQPTF
ncbi:DUF6356 family protein [Sandarakinorhabdus rubra]|uniref:DUF6356 family protein n=1 Tax=Sandarakinorhabdus rubra TaxID=2672568 RepID=UPI0013DD8144|nr:DUF6356 family protein [Sandarakinorhabdus rubra]